MIRKLSAIVILSLLLAVYFAANVFASQSADNNVWKFREYLTKNSKAKLAGALMTFRVTADVTAR